jgi:hypothetical protein
MSEYKVILSLSAARSRVLLMAGADELMRAVLPPPSQIRHWQAVMSLLQGLAMWLDRAPHVVVSADEGDATFLCGLTDELGNPQRSVYYTVEVVARRVRRRGRRVGVGDFRDLRQLSLVHGGRP